MISERKLEDETLVRYAKTGRRSSRAEATSEGLEVLQEAGRRAVCVCGETSIVIPVDVIAVRAL